MGSHENLGIAERVRIDGKLRNRNCEAVLRGTIDAGLIRKQPDLGIATGIGRETCKRITYPSVSLGQLPVADEQVVEVHVTGIHGHADATNSGCLTRVQYVAMLIGGLCCLCLRGVDCEQIEENGYDGQKHIGFHVSTSGPEDQSTWTFVVLLPALLRSIFRNSF